jgi:hypothetical protein
MFLMNNGRAFVIWHETRSVTVYMSERDARRVHEHDGSTFEWVDNPHNVQRFEVLDQDRNEHKKWIGFLYYPYMLRNTSGDFAQPGTVPAVGVACSDVEIVIDVNAPLTLPHRLARFHLIGKNDRLIMEARDGNGT